MRRHGMGRGGERSRESRLTNNGNQLTHPQVLLDEVGLPGLDWTGWTASQCPCRLSLAFLSPVSLHRFRASNAAPSCLSPVFHGSILWCCNCCCAAALAGCVPGGAGCKGTQGGGGCSTFHCSSAGRRLDAWCFLPRRLAPPRVLLLGRASRVVLWCGMHPAGNEHSSSLLFFAVSSCFHPSYRMYSMESEFT